MADKSPTTPLAKVDEASSTVAPRRLSAVRSLPVVRRRSPGASDPKQARNFGFRPPQSRQQRYPLPGDHEDFGTRLKCRNVGDGSPLEVVGVGQQVS